MNNYTRFLVASLLLWNAACSWRIDAMLSDRADCGENDVRIHREQDFSPCAFTVGERVTVFFKNTPKDDIAILHFLAASDPGRVLATREAPLENGASITLAIPEMAVPPVTDVQVLIQGKHDPGGLTGSFRFRLAARWTAATADGCFLLGIAQGRGFQEVLSQSLPAASGGHGILASRDGRALAAGEVLEPDGSLDSVPLLLFDGASPWAHLVLPHTGGTDAAGFLPAAGGNDASRLLAVQRESGTRPWRLFTVSPPSSGEADPDPVPGTEAFSHPPCIRSTSAGAIVVPRDPDLSPETASFLFISPHLSLQEVSCAHIFPDDDGMIPLDAAGGAPESGILPVLVACVAQDALSGEYRVKFRWLEWAGENLQARDGWPEFEASTCAAPRRLHIPLFDPGPQTPVLLETRPSEEGATGCPWLLLDPSRPGEPLPMEGTGEGKWQALFLDPETLVLYRPAPAADGPDGRLQARRSADGWAPVELPCRLRHAAAVSPRQLLLANADQLIQSTLDDFLSGIPGTVVVNEACDFVAIHPVYR